MKMTFLSYKESMDNEIMALLADAGIKAYTKWKEVMDRGDTGYPKMGTHIWPGFNSALVVAAGDEEAKALMKRIKEFNASRKFDFIKAMQWTIDDMC